VPLSPQRLDVIDLYEASDDDSSDPAPVPAASSVTRRPVAQDAPGAAGSQHQPRAGSGAPTVWSRDREPRTMPAHSSAPQQPTTQHTSLKDRFRTGLDMLQRPAQSTGAQSSGGGRKNVAFGEIDL